MVVSRKRTCVNGLLAEAATFFHETPFLFERTPKRETFVIQTWVYGRHVLKNKLVTSRKTTDNTY